MTGDRIRLEVKQREEIGSAASRRLRRGGLVPGILYGGGKMAHPFAVGERDLRHALGSEHGRNAILDVVFEGQKTAHHAILKDFQLHPTKSRLLHIDLHEIRLDQPIQTAVPLHLVGEAEGVVQGGVLAQAVPEVTIQALPLELPDSLELDVSSLALGDSMRASALRLPENVTLVDDPETVLASVIAPTRIEEPIEDEAAEAAAEEAAAGEEGEPGEEPG